MAATEIAPKEWDAQGNPVGATPASEWDASGNPVTKPTATKEQPTESPSALGELVDMGKAASSLVFANMLGTDPTFIYNNHEEIEKKLGEFGDFKKRIGKAATVKDDPLYMMMKHTGPEPFESQDKLENFVHDASEFAGDPFMWGPALLGTLAGGPVGGRVGSTAGFALDSGLRKALTDHYQKGDATSFGDLASRTAATIWAATKGAITGEAMQFAGGLPVPKAAGAMAETALRGLYQSTAMTVAGSVLDWHVPTLDDFERSAVTVVGLNLATHGVSRVINGKQALLDVYAKDGTTPQESAEKLQAQPPVKPEMPEGLKPAIRITAKDGSQQVITGDNETHAETAERVTGEKPVTMEELEADAAKPATESYREGENAFDREWRLGSEKISEDKVGDTTYRHKATPDGVQIRAVRGGKEIGGVSLTINPDGEGNTFAESNNLEVSESERGKGLARQMYDSLLSIGKQYGIKTIQGERVKTEGGRGLWESLVRDGKAYKTTDQYGQEVYRMDLPEGEVPTQSTPFKRQSLADKVLAQPEIHTQEVIDRAYELKSGEDVPQGAKSGRGFAMVKGDNIVAYMNRKQASRWVKTNEPEVHDMWKDITGDENAEMHSADYQEARKRVSDRNIAEGDPKLQGATKEITEFLAKNREELNDIKASDSKMGTYGKTVIRSTFAGPRNYIHAMGEQYAGRIAKIIPDAVDQEALSFMRDYRDAPEDLKDDIEEVRSGDNEKLKRAIPSMEKALNPTPQMLQADALMTEYFKQANDLRTQFVGVDSSIDPARYSPRNFMLADEEATRGGGGKFSKRSPHDIQREYLRVLDPLKSGNVEARTFNSVDELRVYGDRLATSVARNIFEMELKNSELGKHGIPGQVPPELKAQMADTNIFSQKELEELGGIPKNWRPLPGTEKTIVSGGKQFRVGLQVPPDVAEAMKPILENDVLSGAKYWKLAKLTQAYIKSIELGLSPFHMRALSISFMNNAGLDAYRKAVFTSNNSPEFEAQERNAALYGLTTTKTSTPYEAYRGMKDSSLEPSNTLLSKVKSGYEPIDKIFKGVTEATFDVAQRKFKVIDFSTREAKWLAKNPNATDAEYGTAMRSIAKEVNAVYGGLNWDVMGVSANYQAVARMFLLAPDWTFSNVANLKYAFEGGPGGNAARMFWLKSFVTATALNQGMSLMLTGQPSKQWDKVYLGKDDKGKEMYASVFLVGAPKDAVGLINKVAIDGFPTGAVEFSINKAAPLFGTGSRMLLNKDWQGKPITKPKDDFTTKTEKEVGFGAEQLFPAPFVVKDIADRMMNPDEDLTYKDFLAALVGAQVYHEGKKQPGISSRKFHLKGAR